MGENLKFIITSLVSGGLFMAVFEAIKEFFVHRRDRREKKEDEQESKNNLVEENSQDIQIMKENIQSMKRKTDALSEAMKLMLLQSILEHGESYVEKGEISFEEKKRLFQMHRVYHEGLEGNGDADFIMDAVDELQIKSA